MIIELLNPYRHARKVYKWFAWYPVRLWSGNRMVWLQFIQKVGWRTRIMKYTEWHYYTMDEKPWEVV